MEGEIEEFEEEEEEEQPMPFIPMGLFMAVISRSVVYDPSRVADPLTTLELKAVTRQLKGLFTRFRHKNNNRVAMRMLITKPFVGVTHRWQIQVFITLQLCQERDCGCIQRIFMYKLRRLFKQKNKTLRGLRCNYNQYFDRETYKRYKWACFKNYKHYYEYVDCAQMSQCPYWLRKIKKGG